MNSTTTETPSNSPGVNLANDIYWVPVERVFFSPCSEGRDLQGGQATYFLVEGSSGEEARISLKVLPNYARNFVNLPSKERRGAPFRLLEGKVEQVLPCERRFKNSQGDYTCGRPIESMPDHEIYDDTANRACGELGMCCIEWGYDVPKGIGCPYEKADRVRPDTLEILHAKTIVE